MNKLRIAFTEQSVSFYRGKTRVYRENFIPVEFFANLLTGRDKRTAVYAKIARKVIAKTLRERQLLALRKWREECYATERPLCLDWTPRTHFCLSPVVAKIDIKNLNEMIKVRSGVTNAQA